MPDQPASDGLHQVPLFEGLINVEPDNEHLGNVPNPGVDFLELGIGFEIQATVNKGFRSAKVAQIVRFKRHCQRLAAPQAKAPLRYPKRSHPDNGGASTPDTEQRWRASSAASWGASKAPQHSSLIHNSTFSGSFRCGLIEKVPSLDRKI
jgi:hypothetical protein